MLYQGEVTAVTKDPDNKQKPAAPAEPAKKSSEGTKAEAAPEAIAKKAADKVPLSFLFVY